MGCIITIHSILCVIGIYNCAIHSPMEVYILSRRHIKFQLISLNHLPCSCTCVDTDDEEYTTMTMDLKN